ncbi:FxSxx-COOH system tetratricopeptide repeat protein [Streptomyces sp. ME02-8801-2C]|uniref:FxSxx-COOH system tetratricopeptide repeat protein n=1 Tax=Streptomyces sp. ME02-8801-2C TaxID=3028680 RepID=UPI0029BCAE37|nr:FxSxx-COOH system tetratricopeptide repeat protein [Streptomyces sp. ME02-8801-2C]MDX3451039.1 FxSxx-COOH system tetratricopeptide repeat protein [Streptomyces sp. ME02-8801-2C]
MADRAGGARSHGHTVISYAGFNRPWATWIAYQLEQLGHRTTLLRWDPPVSMSLAEALRSLLEAPGRILLVLDDWYFNLGPRSDEEWIAALREVVPEHEDRFAAVSVATRAIPPGGERLLPVDLRDLDAGEARRRILVRLGLPAGELSQSGDFAPRFPNDPPAVLNIPRRNLRFTGRDGALEELHSQLNQGEDGVSRVALRGISGVGKSQIAIEYAHRFGNDYDVVWWVNAGFRATAREQFADLAPRLQLWVGSELGERIRAVHEALRTGKPLGRWLVIFDSADDMAQVEDLLPEGNGHVLVTTLTQDWATSGRLSEIKILPFIREESVAYVRRRAPRLTEQEADRLADAVQDLPLLLAQTAAWLDANRMPAKDYIELISKGGANQIGIRISDDYPMGFQTSWSITLNTLEANHPEASELLRLFALFSPDAIPVRLIQKAHPSDLPDHLASLAADPFRWYAALQRLSESTAVQLVHESSSEDEPLVGGATMHRLYHSFLTSALPEERREAMSSVACEVLAGADPRDPGNVQEWPKYAELLAQLESSGALDSIKPAVRRLVLNCVEYLRARGEGQDGLALCTQTLARWRSRLEPDDPDMLVLTHQHANMLRRVGRFREAEAVARATVDRLAEVREADDPELLRAKNGLGGTLLALGAYVDAYQLWRDERDRGTKSSAVSQGRSNLALTLLLLGNYQEAAELHRHILKMRQASLEENHPQILISALYYAWTLRLLGSYDEAKSRQERNCELLMRDAGEWHPNTLLAQHNLALCLRRTGELAQAEHHMRHVVEYGLRKRGPSHPDTLHTQADYATFLREHGDLGEARKLADEVTNGYHDLVGPTHPFTIGTTGNVGLVLWKYGEREEALRIAETTWSGMAGAVGADHPWTLGCALNLSGARSYAGDEERAAQLSRDTLRRATAVLGENHPMALSCKAALAADLRSLRRGDEAAGLEQEALRALTGKYGSSHPHTTAVGRRDRPYWDFEPQPT